MRIFDDAAERAGFVLDDEQRRAARRLAELPKSRGVYLWGPVGRGKSWLTTVLFAAVDSKHKLRLHFHEFFREFHAAYARHRHRPRAAERALDELLGRCRFLCFDEFHVHDPGDAMLVAAMLRALVDRGVVLLTTSNYPPAGLLPNPLHHHLFEPAIALIEEMLDVVELAGDRDYRAERGEPRSNFERGRYLWPGTAEQLRDAGLVPPGPAERRALTVSGRPLRAEAVRGDLVWFDFGELCDTPTSTVDYLTLADRYPEWVIAGLTGLDSPDAAQRFANVIDVLCDRDLRLTLVGDRPLPELLPACRALDFARTASRLSLL
ncbi:cell division protein ZapE [Actinokineospora xionganensis]|uniref:Cell division protein ZapE n=1 Tax=Actinokineospora xionganensis TaxID=2684470 RepID=A0ABR7L7S6_9PSEU|nr:cell division protein ZapE [Actinokineospora xionganensis]MBC6448765.1 cell division protein ZapE [Actinokineospora xionganensis]